jgi:TP901 family phage tail tape measure protein
MGAVADKLRIEITVDDKGTPVIQYFKGQTKAGLEDVTKTASKTATGFSSLWKGMMVGQAVFTAIYSGLRMVKSGLTGTIGDALAFEREFANVTTLLSDGSEVTSGMRQEMLEMAGSLGSATELTEGLYNALSAGIEPAKAVEFIGTSAKFSKAALAGMYQSVDVLTTILNAYGLEASEVTDVSDVLFQVIKDGKITGEQLAGSLGKVIPTAAAMGVNIREVGAAVAIMTQSGIGADEAMTALNQTLISALNPTKDSAEMAKKLGIDLSRAGIEGAGGLQKWLAQLKDKIGDNTEAMGVLFPNVRALKSALALAGEQSAKYAQEMEILKNVTGVTDEAFKKQQATLSAVWEAIKNKLSAVMIDTLLPALQSVREWLEKNKATIIDYGKRIIAFAADAARAIGSVIGWFVRSKDAILAIGAAMAAVFVANKIQLWYRAIDVAGSGIMTIVQRAQMLKVVGVSSVSAYSQSISYASGKVAGLSGLASKLPAIGAAAFVGWKVGELIGELTGLNKVMQDVFTKALNLAGLNAKEKAVQSAISEQRAVSIEEIRKMGKELGVSTSALGVNVSAIYNNKTAMEKLSPSAQAIVERMSELRSTAMASAAALEEEKKKREAAAAALEEEKRRREEAARAAAAAAAAALEAENKLSEALDDRWQKLNENIIQEQAWADFFKAKMGPAIESYSDNWAENVDVMQMAQEAMDGMQGTFNKLAADILEKGDQVKADEIVQSWQELEAQVQAVDRALGYVDDMFSALGINASGVTAQISKGLGAVSSYASGMASMSKAGASFTDKLTGITSIIGAVSAGISILTTVIKALAGDGVGEAIARENEWMHLTEQQTEQIRELEKQYGSTHAATSELLDQFISSADITADSFDLWADRVHGILSDLDQGKMSMGEVQAQMGDAFTALISQAQALGTEGSASLIAFFEDLAGRGIQVAEVNAYIAEQLGRGFEGYKNMKAAIEESQDAQEAFGTLSIGIFEEMLSYEKKVGENQELVNSITGATQALEGLSNAQRLTENQYDQFSAAAVTAYDKLIDQGFTSTESLKTMGPYLQRLQMLHEQYGFTVDDNTQKILDQAKQEGIVIENKKSEQREIIDLLGIIAKQLGADIPGALDTTAKAATNAFEKARREAGAFDETLDRLSQERTFTVKTKGQGDYVSAASGFYSPALPQDTVIQAHRGEEVSVVPVGESRGRQVTNIFHIHDATNPENVAQRISSILDDNTGLIRSKIESIGRA